MRNVISLISILLLSSSFALAQERTPMQLKKHERLVRKSKTTGKPVHSLDTIFNAGEPYCLYIVADRMLGNVLEATISSLDGTEAMWLIFKNRAEYEETPGHLVTFSKTGRQAFIPADLVNTVERKVVHYKLFTNGVFDSTREQQFAVMHPLPLAVRVPTVNVNIQGTGGGGYQTVERNRNGLIQVMGTEIRQSGVVVGTVKRSSEATGGAIVNQIQVHLPNGMLVCTAKAVGVNSHSWQVVTAKDNTAHRVEASIGNDAEKIAKFLIDRLYL